MMKRFIFMLSVTIAAACGDQQVDREVDEQGNETAGVPVGPFHRPGRACVVCHQDGGEASDDPFTVAGTVFAANTRTVGVGGASILLTDSDGSKFIATTNCVGNFFVKPGDWQPKYPIIVDIQKGTVRRTMSGPIGRASDCGACHKLNVKNPLSEVDHIYLFGTDEPGLPGGDPACPVNPIVPGTQ